MAMAMAGCSRRGGGGAACLWKVLGARSSPCEQALWKRSVQKEGVCAEQVALGRGRRELAKPPLAAALRRGESLPKALLLWGQGEPGPPRTKLS